jgi:Flp pilus assembly pilin Flp
MSDIFTKLVVAAQVRLSMGREQGQGMTEYALLLIVIVGVVFAAVKLFGVSLSGLFSKAIDTITNAGN